MATTRQVDAISRRQNTLAHAISAFVAESPLNRLKDIDGSPMWQEPLVGYADGDDPLFALYKTVASPRHMTPREALALAAAAGSQSFMRAPAVSVVSWILPAARSTVESNRRMTEGASLRWNHTRFQGEEFNDALRRHVVGVLHDMGIVAVAPVLGTGFNTHLLSNGMASTWSERHIAYAAGLGTFSLSDGLITERGVAHRCGSVVYAADCTPTPRPYSNHRAYCAFAVDGSCGDCIQRCPAGAITVHGHDKIRCRQYVFETLAAWAKDKAGYIGSYAACGLCQTAVPCESGIPLAALR